MKNFKQFINESIIDLPRKTFAKAIFDKANTDSPILKSEIRDFVLQGLKPFEKIAPVVDFQLIGSILTHRYRDDADLDINVWFDADEETHEKLKELAWKLNGKNVPGTKHPVNYFAVITKEYFKRAGEMADATFDIKKNEITRKVVEKPFSIEAYLDDFKNEVSKIDIVKGELKRDIVDYKALTKFDSNEIVELQLKLKKKINEIEKNIKDLVDIYHSARDDRNAGFATPMTLQQIKKYGEQNRLPKNVIYKLLERYYYFDFIHKVEEIIGEDEKLSSGELKKLTKMVRNESFLAEGKGGKNLHLEHLEDEIINYGVDGGRAAINFLRSLRDMLAGSSRSSVNMTVKWDGAPAIFAGIDPEDDKFFVAKKSVFNVNPKLYKTNAEIDADLSGTLNAKFKVALKEFSKLGITGVLQGDLMFTDDVKTETIDGISYYTFQPNTIVYAIPVNSDLGKTINKAKIGIVWHTTYTGNALQDMTASFGMNISKLSKSSTVWMDDATYKDTAGKSTFTKIETEKVTNVLSQVGKTFQKINANQLRSFIKLQESMTGAIVGASLKTYNNSKVRAGEKISNPKAHAQGYVKWVEISLQKQIDKANSVKGKDKYTNIQKQYIIEVKKHVRNLEQIITFQNLLVDAKMQIVQKLNSVKGLTDTFIKTRNGFKVTNPEGYVAIDRVSGGAVKLVDRMEFSFNNFTAIKAWDK